MKAETFTLKNGARIIGLKMPGVKSVAVNFGFRTGSRNETPKIAGMSHFLEHMMFKGSEKRPTTAAIAKEADRIGAVYNASTGKECTRYYLKTSRDNFELGLDIIGDMATRPLLSGVEIKKESGTIIEEIKMYEDNPMVSIHGKMEGTLYGTASEMGRDIAGKASTVKRIDARLMRKYFKETYVAKNAVLALAGNLPADYRKKAEKYLMRLPVGRRSLWPEPNWGRSNCRLITKKTEQAHLGLCLPAYSVNDGGKYAAEVFATALGGYMSARLFTEIREKRGWAYRIWAYNDTYSDTGYLGVFGGIKKDKLADSIKIVKEEIYDFAKNFKKEEVERAKNHLSGSFTLKYDDPEKRAGYAVSQSLLSEQPESPEEFVEKIRSVTEKDLKKVARKMADGKNFYLTVIGPYKNKEKFAKILLT